MYPKPDRWTAPLWPQNKAEVIAIASRWYDPDKVQINSHALEAFAGSLPEITPGADPGMRKGAVDLGKVAELAIALNSINYQFWALVGGNMHRYAFEGTVGAMGMRLAFEQAWADPQSPLRQAQQGLPLTPEAIQTIFGDIPDPAGRARILNEVLAGPLEEMAAQVAYQLQAGQEIDTTAAYALAQAFPQAYGDMVLKKAQLAVSEAWVVAREQGVEASCNLTAFADYQIPNILRAVGVLDYAPELAGKIERLELIGENSFDEQAIRGASILAVEQIAQIAQVPVAAVDHYLWMRRKEATTPFHLTLTTAY